MTTRTHRDGRGFTLIEMSVVILLLGLIFAFSIPAFVKLNRSLTLKGTVSNLASQMQIARQKAMGTGVQQVVCLNLNFGASFHTHPNSLGDAPQAHWKFAKGVSYITSGTLAQVTMTPDGRASQSGLIILEMTPGGLRDTVYVQRSGMVVMQ